MLVCKKCGSDNPLGRVFCGGCGSKLDLSDMTSQAVGEYIRPSFFVAHWRKFAMGVAVIVLGTAALAMWPKTAPLGMKGTTDGSSRALRQFSALRNVTGSRSLTVEIAEGDINGYLEYRKIRKTPVEMCSVMLLPQTFRARLIKPLGSWPVGPFLLQPKISYDVRCVAMGGQLVVASASIGHLKAIGPLRRVAVNPYLKLFAGGKEVDVLKGATEITIDTGKVSIKAGR